MVTVTSPYPLRFWFVHLHRGPRYLTKSRMFLEGGKKVGWSVGGYVYYALFTLHWFIHFLSWLLFTDVHMHCILRTNWLIHMKDISRMQWFLEWIIVQYNRCFQLTCIPGTLTFPRSSTFSPPKEMKKKRNPNTEYMALEIEKDQKETFSARGVKFYHLTTPFHSRVIKKTWDNTK